MYQTRMSGHGLRSNPTGTVYRKLGRENSPAFGLGAVFPKMPGKALTRTGTATIIVLVLEPAPPFPWIVASYRLHRAARCEFYFSTVSTDENIS